MPVVNFKIEKMMGIFNLLSIEEIINKLPYVGLDIEGIDREYVRIEYNPNRPDFSFDYGIARALKGILGMEKGIPSFKITKSDRFKIILNGRISSRPHIAAFIAKSDRIDEDTIKQIIAMQEDLHNGLGRNRRKASIGVHDLQTIKFPIMYKKISNPQYSFVPLNSNKKMTVEEVIDNTEQGKNYSQLVQKLEFPIIEDSDGETVSFPPIINSEKTKLNSKTKNLLIEVTGTNKNTVEDIIAIMASNLYEAKFEIHNAIILANEELSYPNLQNYTMAVDIDYINNILGLSLTKDEIIKCIEKSRISVIETDDKVLICNIPRYRIDITKEIDLVEEVLLGFGVENLLPSYPSSNKTGNKNQQTKLLDKIRMTLIGLGLTEVINYSLTDLQTQYKNMQRELDKDVISVINPKSIEYEILRESILPSILFTLSHNIHSSYPQNFFEIGKVFNLTDTVDERLSLGIVLSDSFTNFNSIKTIAQSLFETWIGKEITTIQSDHTIFISGRGAEIYIDNHKIGKIGEIDPNIIEAFKIRVPISALEIDLSSAISMVLKEKA